MKKIVKIKLKKKRQIEKEKKRIKKRKIEKEKKTE